MSKYLSFCLCLTVNKTLNLHVTEYHETHPLRVSWRMLSIIYYITITFNFFLLQNTLLSVYGRLKLQDCRVPRHCPQPNWRAPVPDSANHRRANQNRVWRQLITTNPIPSLPASISRSPMTSTCQRLVTNNNKDHVTDCIQWDCYIT